MLSIINHEANNFKDPLGMDKKGEILLNFILGLLPICIIYKSHFIIVMEVPVQFAPIVVSMVFFVLIQLFETVLVHRDEFLDDNDEFTCPGLGLGRHEIELILEGLGSGHILFPEPVIKISPLLGVSAFWVHSL